jgi:hypothetical protein
MSCNFTEAVLRVAAKVIFVLLFTTTGVFAVSETPTLIPKVWEQSFGDEQYSYESKAAMIAPSGMLTVVGTYTPVKNRHTPPEGGWIWKIDSNGKKISDVRFDSNISGLKLAGIDAIELIGSDVVAIAGRLSNGKSSLLHIDVAGKVVKTQELGNRRIAKLFRMSDGSLMLAGQKNGDLLLMKLDKSGAIVWEKVTDRGKDDSLIDGSIADDHLLLVELSGKQEQFLMADSVIGLVTPAADGKVDAPVFTTKGRNGSLARNLKRTALVYDAAMNSDQDIRLVMLDSDYHVVREAPITKGKFSLEKFTVGNAGESAFILAGTAGGKMVVAAVNTSGLVQWQNTRVNDKAFFMNPEVVSGDAAYIVSTMMVLTSDKQPKTLVNVLKIGTGLPRQ